MHPSPTRSVSFTTMEEAARLWLESRPQAILLGVWKWVGLALLGCPEPQQGSQAVAPLHRPVPREGLSPLVSVQVKTS